MVIGIFQNMVLISRRKLFHGDVVEVVVDDDVVKLVGNFEGVIKPPVSLSLMGMESFIS